MEKEELQIEIGLIIKEARIKCGIRQAELAQRLHTTSPVLSRIEAGRAMPSLDFLLRVANELGARFNAPYFDFWTTTTKTTSYSNH